MQQQQQGFVAQFKAALCQLAGHPVPLEELVRHLCHKSLPRLKLECLYMQLSAHGFVQHTVNSECV